MARKDITMNEVEIAEFLESARTLQVGTLDARGWPHLAPMWFVVDGGHIVFRSFSKSQKIVNLERDSRITVLLETGNRYEELRGVMIQGRGRLVRDRNEVLRIYGLVAARYALVGETTTVLEGDALEAAFGRYADKNTAVIVEPERTITWDHTKLGGAY
ncbi:MAG: hypothetical protein HKN07_13655 [Acidimicrobiia bacterium]|nr:hypothetical protein [Acidimicrobiia bacterium]